MVKNVGGRGGQRPEAEQGGRQHHRGAQEVLGAQPLGRGAGVVRPGRALLPPSESFDAGPQRDRQSQRRLDRGSGRAGVIWTCTATASTTSASTTPR